MSISWNISFQVNTMPNLPMQSSKRSQLGIFGTIQRKYSIENAIGDLKNVKVWLSPPAHFPFSSRTPSFPLQRIHAVHHVPIRVGLLFFTDSLPWYLTTAVRVARSRGRRWPCPLGMHGCRWWQGITTTHARRCPHQWLRETKISKCGTCKHTV
jgi:hypothetical protein